MEEIEEIITNLQIVVDGKPLEAVTAAITAFLSEIVFQWHKSPEEIRRMYRLWADAAILMAEIQDGFTSNTEFQAAQNSAQKEGAEAAGQAAWDVPGSPTTH